MSIINVPIINHPDTALPVMLSVQSEYALSFSAANPDGTPANCQTGGPGILGGPEYINLLQRANPSTNQKGYSVEQFELSAHPGYTFFSFKNFETGVKNVVAFDQAVANTPVAAWVAGGITSTATPAPGATPVACTVTACPHDTAASYVWAGSVIASIVGGQGHAAMTYTAITTLGAATLYCTITDSLGNVVTEYKAVTVT